MTDNSSSDRHIPKGSRYSFLDLQHVQTIPVRERKNLVSIEDFACPFREGTGMRRFLEHLPLTRHRTNAAGSLKDVAHRIVECSASAGKLCGVSTWAFGPHVIKYGLSLLLIDLMERGLVSALATTGAGAIHDSEIALFGETSEEMTGEIQTGRFGMARETGEFLNGAAQAATEEQIGFGEALGRGLANAPFATHSLLASAYRLNIPATVHVALGTDIVHTHPSFDGAATGKAAQYDFQLLAAAIDRIDSGGIHLNIASSVVLPEIFLKTLTVANNLRQSKNLPALRDFWTVNVDHQSEYRPLMNVVRRPTVDVGRGIELLGRIEIMVPLLVALISDILHETSLSKL